MEKGEENKGSKKGKENKGRKKKGRKIREKKEWDEEIVEQKCAGRNKSSLMTFSSRDFKTVCT